MRAQRPELVAHPATDGGVGLGKGIEHRRHRRRFGDVDLDAGRPAGMRSEGGGEANRDLQGSTAVFTQVTGGRWRAASCHDSPASGEAKTSPVRVPM